MPNMSLDQLARTVRRYMPNVTGLMVKVINGAFWQGRTNDPDEKAINGPVKIEAWVNALARHGLSCHVWGVPRGLDSAELISEAELYVEAARVAGVRSILLDVEHGNAYWQGTPAMAGQMARHIRTNAPAGTHVAMIVDGRRNRDFGSYVDPWIPHIDSLHPMIYPIMFDPNRPMEDHFEEAYRNLQPYQRPIVPMMQSCPMLTRRPTPKEIARQATVAQQLGAEGVSYYRLGRDRWSGDAQPLMGLLEYAAVSAAAKEMGRVLAETVVQPAWERVINALKASASLRNQNWQQWVALADVTIPPEADWQTPYTGKPIAEWYVLTASIRTEIDALMKIDANTLRRLAERADERAQLKGDARLGQHTVHRLLAQTR